MLKEVTIAIDNLNPETWIKKDVDDVLAFIKETFPDKFPDTARIYHMSVCQTNDVTPGAETVEKDITHIQSLPGPFFVVVFPEATALPYIIAIVLAVASYVLAPGVPRIAAPQPLALTRNQQAASPNNELSDRSNRARINGRIADIYGTVRSVPDLIAAPYKIFENNREVEFAYMCIGRGEYDVSDIRDGATLASRIPGTSVMVYPPYVSPNQYDPNVPGSATPQLTIGELRRVPIIAARRSNSVNGQVLRPPNAVSWDHEFDGQSRLIYPNIIENDGVHDFTQFFVEGDEITITGAAMDGSPITSNITFIAAKGDVVYNYPGGTKTFVLGVGALLFPSAYASILAGVFGSAGHTWSITTNSVTSVGAISGTYTTRGTPAIDGPTDAAQQAAGVPSYFVVKVINPDSVNVNWNNIPAGSRGVTYVSPFTYMISPFNVDLDGNYIITSVTSHVITLDNPNATSTDWTAVMATELATPFLNVDMSSEGTRWVGPFILEDAQLTEVYCNFVASNGLYKDSGTVQTADAITLQVELTPVDETDTPIADPETQNITLTGSSFLKETVADTMKFRPTFYGRCQIRARRITEADEDFDGQVVDEIRWRDAYSIAPVNKTDFGNVTTVFSITLATASALAVKERKLNMLVQRRIPTYESGAFTSTLAPTKDAALILAAICRDQYIGNRSNSELDVANFFDTADAVETYFGTPRVREFNYTFDKEDTSFEEMVDSVARAMFCVAYRRGSVIRLSFEKLTNDSTLLFNHRNKIPGTEKRSIRFGVVNDNDGIEYTYVDPKDDSINTIFLPPGVPAINPKKIESIGVRDHLAGYFHAWRIWNRLRFQNMSVEFDATQEADLLVINDRILVSDGTRPKIQEGEVDEIVGTELTLSQVVDLTDDPPYTIFLQHFDATVEAIEITAGSAANKVVLDSAPIMDLVTAKNMYAKTTYLIVGANDVTQKAFLVTEKSAPEGMISTVTAVNYNAGYYANDLDFINNIIGVNGYGETGGFTPGIGNGYPTESADAALVDRTIVISRVSAFHVAHFHINMLESGELQLGTGNPGAGYTLTVDGNSVVTTGVGGTLNYLSAEEWIPSSARPPNLALYDARLTVISGHDPDSSGSQQVKDIWYELDDTVTIPSGQGAYWSHTHIDSAAFTDNLVWQLDIRRRSDSTIIATATYTVSISAN